jgi:osmoprotectant transport system ATP-binding protein
VLEQYGAPAEVLAAPANAFVTDFLGSERGLKRLSLIPVTDVDLRRGPVIDASADVEEAKRTMDDHRLEWVGVLDGARLRGWVWRDELVPGEPVGAADVRDFRVWIDHGASLREALDAIVNSRNQVAVVYDGDRYLGLLTVEDLSQELVH